jgi:hypothetical protein
LDLSRCKLRLTEVIIRANLLAISIFPNSISGIGKVQVRLSFVISGTLASKFRQLDALKSTLSFCCSVPSQIARYSLLSVCANLYCASRQLHQPDLVGGVGVMRDLKSAFTLNSVIQRIFSIPYE